MFYIKNHSSYLTGNILLFADHEKFSFVANNMRTDELVLEYNLLDCVDVRICLDGVDITEKVASQVVYDLSCEHDLVNDYNRPDFVALGACLPYKKIGVYNYSEGWLYEAASKYQR